MKKSDITRLHSKTQPKRTSIGKGRRSRPLNKHKRRNWKRYRGQGK